VSGSITVILTVVPNSTGSPFMVSLSSMTFIEVPPALPSIVTSSSVASISDSTIIVTVASSQTAVSSVLHNS